MTTTYLPAGVTLLDHGRYHVISSKGDDIYLCDLAELRCTCPHYVCRVASHQARQEPGAKPALCKHLAQCLEFAAWLYVAGLQPKPKHNTP